MKKIILVLTNSEDGIHSEVVIEKLLKLDEKVFRMDSDRLAKGSIKVLFNSSQLETEFIFEDKGKSVSSKEIKSVWYRRPNLFNFSIKDPIQKIYAEKEILSFLGGLWALLPKDVFWLSNPNSLECSRKKIYQLEMARSFGLKIPKTIISNNPDDVRDFYKTCNGKIIFKAIYHEFLDYGKKTFNIPTTLVTEKHLENLDLIRTLPSLFQEYIEKEYELRVTVVGEKIFVVKIDSQKNPFTMVDWRHPDYIDKLSYTQDEIPNDIANICLKMLKELNLSFGAFDFVVNSKGELFFLEVNPNGQWYWLEDKTGVLISDAITNILKEGGV